MDATDLSASILNFAKLTQKISKDYLEDKQVLRVDICAFEEWSLDAIANLEVIDTVKSIALATAPLLPSIISTTVDILELGKFLRWGKPQKVTASKNEPWKVEITNQQWDVASFNHRSFIHYGDNNVHYHVTQYVSPTKNDERLTWQSILNKDWERIVNISKEEASYFNQTEELVSQEVVMIGKVYYMNTETLNGKIDVSWLKISISFKKVYDKVDFSHLVKSLKYKASIKIVGEAIIDINSSDYKNIDISSVSLLQEALFDSEE